ncbi:hypothetical protein [Gluconacetobacter tumulicola]
MSALFAHDQLHAWGWRIPFLPGLSVVPFGFFLRREMQAVSLIIFRDPRPGEYLPDLTLMSGTIMTYVRILGVSYTISVLHLSPSKT